MVDETYDAAARSPVVFLPSFLRSVEEHKKGGGEDDEVKEEEEEETVDGKSHTTRRGKCLYLFITRS